MGAVAAITKPFIQQKVQDIPKLLHQHKQKYLSQQQQVWMDMIQERLNVKEDQQLY
jgi:hypothetical protein